MRRLAVLVAACASAPVRPFPLREPFTRDTDLADVAVPCRADPSRDDPHRVTCAPREYESPFYWDQADNLAFARLSRGLSVEVHGEARNANSLDEVADSAWFTNRDAPDDDRAPGACTPDDMLPAEVPDGTWAIDRGKDNGSTLGFRIEVPGKGKYMLKADDPGIPERSSAASVIGAAIYDAVGYFTSCEQIVVLRRGQLKLLPHLKTVENSGVRRRFDEAALAKVLASTTQLPGGRVRMQASKWLPGVTIGPFRYIGTRPDDPNDVIDHADRRELRGSRLLAAWLDHWDAREQNSLDVWLAADRAHPRSSPGHVVHYFLDTSDTLGQVANGPRDFQTRQGFSYELDVPDIARALVTLGLDERPWDRATLVPGREKFGYYRAADFDPAHYKPFYPNPAFLRMTERDAAWMARKLARFSDDDIRRFAALGQFSDPADTAYLATVMRARQRAILARYLMHLSPLADVRARDDRICAVDFARLRNLAPTRYTIEERRGDRGVALAPELADAGTICFRTVPLAPPGLRDGDPAQRVTIVVRNGTTAGPLVIHAYDLGARGMRVAGLERPE